SAVESAGRKVMDRLHIARPTKSVGRAIWIASILLDQLTLLVAISHDQTPMRPVSSALRTIAEFGKKPAANRSAASSGCSTTTFSRSSGSMDLQFDLIGRRSSAHI